MTQQKSPFYAFTYQKDIIEPMPSQPPSLEDDKQDTLVAWQLQREIQILLVILIMGIIFLIGLVSPKVENAILFALFLSGIIIAVVFSLLLSS